jgi:hypothetical protein
MTDYLAIARRVVAEKRRTSQEPLESLPNERVPLEEVLKGTALLVVSDIDEERIWIVADEDDAALLDEPRGTVYTAQEVRVLASIRDPQSMRLIRQFKREIGDGRLSGKAISCVALSPWLSVHALPHSVSPSLNEETPPGRTRRRV